MVPHIVTIERQITCNTNFVAFAFSGDGKKALLATFFLAAVPCYLSHFIWAHALTLTMFFPLMYAILKMKEDQHWMWVALLMMAGIWVSQNFELPIKLLTLLLIYGVIESIIFKKVSWRIFAVSGGGVLLSFFWWVPIISKYGWKLFASYYLGGGEEATGTMVKVASSGFNPLKYVKALFAAGGTGSRAYGLNDFFWAQKENMINNPIGIGWVLCLLVLIGMGYVLWNYRSRLMLPEKEWLAIALFWLIFAFWGVNGVTFPISVARGAFRMWMVLAIPLVLIAVEGVYFLQALGRSSFWKVSVLLVLLLGVLFTSAYPKYEQNISGWPTSGSFQGGAGEEQQYGEWFTTLPLNTKVFLFSPRDKLTIGFNAYSCAWCQHILDFRQHLLDRSGEELARFLRQEEYAYVVINGPMDYKYFSSEYGDKTKERLEQRYDEISKLFIPVYQKGTMAVFKVS